LKEVFAFVAPIGAEWDIGRKGCCAGEGSDPLKRVLSDKMGKEEEVVGMKEQVDG
jgi:hypothetical protein